LEDIRYVEESPTAIQVVISRQASPSAARTREASPDGLPEQSSATEEELANLLKEVLPILG
jgi:hypothetical protein